MDESDRTDASRIGIFKNMAPSLRINKMDDASQVQESIIHGMDRNVLADKIKLQQTQAGNTDKD